MTRISLFRSVFKISILFLLLVWLNYGSSAPVYAQPSFSMQFTPDTIGPGSTSTLTYTINNGESFLVEDIAFSNDLPAGMSIADPASVAVGGNCGSAYAFTAPAGGTTVAFSNGGMPANTTCTLEVNVTSNAAPTAGSPVTHSNTSSLLTSSAGSSGPATDDLTITADLPGFTKNFSPDIISFGGRSILTLTVDNTANASSVSTIRITDNLPTGLLIADPPIAETDCGNALIAPTLTAEAGTNVISMFANGIVPNFPALAAGASCTVTVNVVADSFGFYDNVTSDLEIGSVATGKATDRLIVQADTLNLYKIFSQNPAPVGSTLNLEFTISNFGRTDTITDIAFTDDLDAFLNGTVAIGLPATDVCGAGSTFSGTNTLTLTGGTLAAGESCTFSVSIQLPNSAIPDAYTNTTSTISGMRSGSPITGLAASNILQVSIAPIFSKAFLDDPSIAGDTTVLEYTLTNPSPTDTITEISFEDIYPIILETASVAPPAEACGAGSTATFTPLFDPSPPCNPCDATPAQLTLSGGTLGPGETCTFSLTLDIDADAGSGDYVSKSSAVTASNGVTTQYGNSATDTLTVVSPPSFSMKFNDPAAPGDAVSIEFTIAHSPDEPSAATGITFSNDLGALLAGMTATFPPNPDPPCGVGSTLTGSAGDSVLTLANGTLQPGESCTFTVDANIPLGTAVGRYDNTTSALTATVSGISVSGPSATDELLVSGLSLTKEFIDDPALPGDTVTLRFTLDNTKSQEEATNVFFLDSLSSTLSGLTAVPPLPVQPCGAGSTVSGTTTLIFSGGQVAAGQSCTFDVTVLVPASAADGTYVNVTSSPSATIDGTIVTLDPAANGLIIDTNLISLEKEFTDDPVAPGDPVTLEFTLTNLDATRAASSIAFTDNLDAALADLTFDAILLNDCGATITGQGTTMIDFSGGALAAGDSCTAQVSLTVPADATPEAAVINTTSSVTGLINGIAVTGDAALDELEVIRLIEFSQAFDSPAYAGGVATLSFTLTNPGTDDVSGISFIEDLDAALSGLVASNLPAAPCGEGSQILGTSTLTFSGGSLPASGGTCTFDVELTVPASAAPGTYPVTSGNLSASGLSLAAPTTADLTIEPPPSFDKTFTPDVVYVGQVSQLTFIIDNTASSLETNSMAFTDNLPAGLLVANPSNGATTCTGGSLTAVPGTAVITYSGGAVAAGATCTVSVNVTATTSGALVNVTGDLTSNAGNSGTATGTLSVNFAPSFSKTFSPDTILVNGLSSLTFTIDNSGGVDPATDLDFTDDLPAEIRVAPSPNASTTCTGGTLTAPSGNTLVIYSGGSVAAGATCTVSVDVISLVAGVHTAESGELTSSFGPSGTALATLTVIPPTGLTQRFAPAEIDTGETSTLTLTINNSASSIAATDIAFTNTLPAEVAIVTPVDATTTCTGGTLNADPVTGIITYAGGTAMAGTSCSVRVAVTSAIVGVHTSSSTGVTSSLGTGNPSLSTLTVQPPPSLRLTYSAAPNTVLETGGAVGFNIRVQNTSPFETLTLTSLNDDLRGNVSNEGACELPQILAADETYNCFYTVIESGPGGTSRTTTMTATALDTDNNPVTAQADATVSFLEVEERMMYIPLFVNTSAPIAPFTDLIVSDISVTNEGIAVTITNQGNTDVVDSFWVDLYINPDPQPTAVNQIWPFLSDEGVVWGIETFTNPTQTVTLADATYIDEFGTQLTDFSGVIPAGSTVCVQVDSAGDDAFGGVLEGHELLSEPYNNITCITFAETVQMPVPEPDAGPATNQVDLSRPQ